jgi:hypothetical protein
MKRVLTILLITLNLMLTTCYTAPAEKGVLEGNVTIGPLQPVEQPGEKPPIPCEVYEARKIMVYNKNGKNLIRQVDIDCDGHYRVDLKPATYTIDINRTGIDHSSQVPRQIEIIAGEVVSLDISIDTGIR